MNIAHLSCPQCGDEWYVPDIAPADVRETCRECGGPVAVMAVFREVT